LGTTALRGLLKAGESGLSFNTHISARAVKKLALFQFVFFACSAVFNTY
jgi:hypothetical protein